MRTIKYNLEIGYCGCNDEGTTTVPDSMSNSDIDQMVYEMAMEHAQGWEGDERLAWDSDMTEEEYDQATEWFYENVCGSWEFVEED